MSDFLASVPELHCFPERPDPPKIIPGRAERSWMDLSTERFAYRCTPLSIANSSGWELILPSSLSATWTGGLLTSDVRVDSTDGNPQIALVAGSVFGHGVLTFHPGYLFRTSPGWALTVRGPPNTIKDGITPLEGLVETDWLSFPFSMNWRFTRPGTIHFNAGECFCFLTMTPHGMLDEIQPKFRDFSDEPDLEKSYHRWRAERFDFKARVEAREPEAVEQGWQKHYLQGRDPSGTVEPVFHMAKRKLRPPK